MIPAANNLALLVGLLQRFSPSGQESTAAKYLAAQMRGLGFETEVDEMGNAVGSLGAGPQEILLLGHIDTVPGYIDVRQEGDQLWGRGAVDAKGPLACMVAAAAQVGARPGWRITVAGAVGEEDDGRGARYLRGRHAPALLVIGEPSNWDRVTLGYKGDAYFWYIVRRSVTHTAMQMESACEAAVKFWNRVAGRCAEINLGKERAFDQLTPNLRAINSSSDGFTETAQLHIGLRLPLGFSLDDVEDELTLLAGDGIVELIRGDPAYKAEKNTPLVRAFLSAIRKAGGSPAFALKTGTSDMNTVAPAWGCPALAYGPGDSLLDHTLDEHILVSEYNKSVSVLADVLWAVTNV
jgi:[amino group carrier protein]-lysine/ornithine hydrolase